MELGFLMFIVLIILAVVSELTSKKETNSAQKKPPRRSTPKKYSKSHKRSNTRVAQRSSNLSSTGRRVHTNHTSTSGKSQIEKEEARPPHVIEALENITYKGKKDYLAHIDLLHENGFVNFFHFTDRSNIPSIQASGGLLSWQESERNSLFIPKPGGDQLSRNLDIKKNLGDYVRLCFHPNHPMKYLAQKEGRIPDPVILKIKLDVAAWSTTLYSDVNAVAAYASIGDTIELLKQINFSLFRNGSWRSEEEKHQFQAEVLVHKFVPSRFIINLNHF